VFYFINSLLNIYFCSGFLCIRYPKFLLEEGARDLYQRVLSPAHASVRLKLQVIMFSLKVFCLLKCEIGAIISYTTKMGL
jgi:hypothetical protein